MTRAAITAVAQDVMDEDVPECASDLPLAAAIGIMADLGVDHLFFLHRAMGRAWPASVLSLRDAVKALAGPEYLKNQGMHAAVVRRRWTCSGSGSGLPNKR